MVSSLFFLITIINNGKVLKHLIFLVIKTTKLTWLFLSWWVGTFMWVTGFISERK